jgi:hypothetical protein
MPRDEIAARAPALIGLVGVMIAVGALALAAVSGPPYLGTSGVNGWLVVFTVALFTALFAVPFWIEARLRDAHPDSDSRWDRAVPLWGAIALLVTVAGALIGVSGDFAGDSLAGSAGLVVAGAGGLVLIAVASVLLSG